MKGWWIKKWFKSMVKWLIYYAAACVLTYIAIRVFEEHLVEEITSLLPIGAIGLLLYGALHVRLFDNLDYSVMTLRFSKVGGHNTFSIAPPSAYDHEGKIVAESLFLLCAPLPLPFIYFFSAPIKLIATGVCLALPLTVITILYFTVCLPREIGELRKNRKSNADYKRRLADELKEQEKKESLGEWKK